LRVPQEELAKYDHRCRDKGEHNEMTIKLRRGVFEAEFADVKTVRDAVGTGKVGPDDEIWNPLAEKWQRVADVLTTTSGESKTTTSTGSAARTGESSTGVGEHEGTLEPATTGVRRIREAVAAGRATPDDTVWNPSTGRWQPISEVLTEAGGGAAAAGSSSGAQLSESSSGSGEPQAHHPRVADAGPSGPNPPAGPAHAQLRPPQEPRSVARPSALVVPDGTGHAGTRPEEQPRPKKSSIAGVVWVIGAILAAIFLGAGPFAAVCK
jgi:hypothetical protein